MHYALLFHTSGIWQGQHHFVREPIVTTEFVHNRTRRSSENILDAHWLSRLRSLEKNGILENIDITPSDSVSFAPDENNDQENRTVDVWEDLSVSETLGYNVLKPSPKATCELISCVSSAGSRDVACLDLRQLNMSAGALSTIRKLVPPDDSKIAWREVEA